jgi:hypothetical protein
MKRPLLLITCTLFAASFFGNAAPTPGCADLTPPGSWSSYLSDGGDRYFELGDGVTYAISGFGFSPAWADGTGQWDWILQYRGAQLSLANVPGTSWYSSSDTNLSFEINLPSLLVKLRNPGGPSSNPYSGHLEMEVAGHAGRFILLATFAGTPSVTYVPETPESWGYTLVTASLTSARICISAAEAPGTTPLTIRGLFGGVPGVELSWNSHTNRLYQFQSCADLSASDWTDLGSPIRGTGTRQSACEPISTGTASRFYRLLEFP